VATMANIVKRNIVDDRGHLGPPTVGVSRPEIQATLHVHELGTGLSQRGSGTGFVPGSPGSIPGSVATIWNGSPWLPLRSSVRTTICS
jgi:hypothetical protein